MGVIYFKCNMSIVRTCYKMKSLHGHPFCICKIILSYPSQVTLRFHKRVMLESHSRLEHKIYALHNILSIIKGDKFSHSKAPLNKEMKYFILRV